MPTIEEGIFDYLTGIPAITDMVGERIYPGVAPPADETTDQKRFPYVVYKKISGKRETSHSGSSNLAHPRFEFTSTDPEYEIAKRLAKLIVEALDGFSGAMGAIPDVDSAVDTELDFFEEKTRLHQVTVDSIIWHGELPL